MKHNYQTTIKLLLLLFSFAVPQLSVQGLAGERCERSGTGSASVTTVDDLCSGTSSQAQQGSFSTGYSYNFETVGSTVTVTFTLLDTDKTGVVAYLWRQSPFAETPMTNTSGLTFKSTLTGQTNGQTISYGVKFAYAGGLSVTKYVSYVVGTSCSAAPADTAAPTGFTATLGTVTSSSAQLLLNGSDDSGTVIYTITYGATTTTVSGTSGVQQVKLISGLSPSTAYSFSITAKDATGNTASNSPIVVPATTLADTSTACDGTSAIAAEGTFSSGYSYHFETSGTSVTATFTLLDTDKTGVVAYLWRETPFTEWPMTNSSGLTFTKTVTGLTPGASVKFSVKFAYAGGLSRTKYFTYTVGDTCGVVSGDTTAPTGFTAALGTVTQSSVQLLLNGSDDSGSVTYTITYGANTTTVSGSSGVQQSKIISGLTAGTAYSFSVTAKDAAGNTAANNPIVVPATTQADTSTACDGTSSIAAEGSFSTGYTYHFETSGTSVTATFTLLDTDKTGVIAYLWRETPFSEWSMTNTSGLTFTKTVTGLTIGASVKFAVKFAYAGGLSRTKYFTYTVGDTCGVVVPDTAAPTGFTATLGTVTQSSVELLLNGSDDSGAVTYTITYGANTTTVSGSSGVQQSKIISGLTAGTAYSFSVTAKDAAGNTAANNPIVVPATTQADTSTACDGTSSIAAEGSFSTGYTYHFETSGTSVTATFTLLDTDKTGVIAYLWRETPFSEWSMTNTSGLTFTKTVTGLTIGASVKFAVKFAYAGGLSRTKYFTYTVGDTCGVVVPDTAAPTGFTATLGTVTQSSVELLLNGSDDSGAVTYTITYGATTTTVSGSSGVQQSKVISGLTAGTAYNFSVTAADAAGNNAANNPIVVPATTLADTNTACDGTSSLAAEGTFSTGYTYHFETSGNSVTATFTLLDTDKTGVVAYLWRETPFAEWAMTNSGGLTFTKTVTGLTAGASINFSVKFAYAGGLSRTKYFTYTVGDTCGAVVTDTTPPTGFTATLGTVTATSVELLLNATDDSGAVVYDVTYGASSTSVTGVSGVQKSLVIPNLTPETAYTFSVEASDAASNEAANNPQIVEATTLADPNTPCAGTSAEAQQGNFSTGYSYSFQTTGNTVTATFTLLDTDKTGVIAYLWKQAPFSETSMTNSSGLTFTATQSGLSIGATVNFAVKFAYAGGLSVTKYISYVVGDNCDGGAGDEEAPTAFTASAGATTSTSIELLLNASDNSGAVAYTVTYGGNTVNVTGESGVEKSVIISNLSPDTDYTFSVTVADAAGNGAANNPIVVNASTDPDASNQCSGTSSDALQGAFSAGYTYNFHTTGTDVTITFTMLDTDKAGVIAYLWQQSPFSEVQMTNSSGLTFFKTISNQVPGTSITYAVKFAYAGGQTVTKYFTYQVGNNCDGSPLDFATTWNGSSWSNGAPVSFDYVATINGDYDSATDGDITASSLTVLSGNVVVSEGSNFVIQGALSVNNEDVDEDGEPDATFTIANNANLMQENDDANSGTIAVIKDSAPIFRLDYTLWGSPVSGQTLGGFSPQTLSNRFYHYNPLSDAYTPIPSTTLFEAGVGYLIRVANTHPNFVDDETPGTPWTGTFIGVPNNGPIAVQVTPNADGVNGYNALGNPYPSPISVQEFYNANAANLGDDTSLYFWRKKNGGEYSSYASLTLMGYIANGQEVTNANGELINYGDAGNGQFDDPDDSENWVLNSGQGFIVQASSNTIVFNNEMRRSVNNGQIFRNAQDAPSKSRLWLNLKAEGGTFHQAMVAYSPTATLGLDFGLDGKALVDSDIAIWSLAGENQLGIQARPSFDASDVVPLGYKITAAGNYTIALDHMDGVFAGDQDIFLRDNSTGLVHDLKQSPYSFTSEPGSIAGRFDVIYAQPLGTAGPVFGSNTIIAYKQGNAINVSTGAIDMQAVEVYDIRGRLLHSENNINAASTTLSGLQASEQMLIVRVTTTDGRKASKKIVL